jgi:PEP-CTERM motif
MMRTPLARNRKAAREAAALLFGGSASDYVISTAGSDPSQINDLTWVSIWGTGAAQVSDTFVQGTALGVPEPGSWALMLVGVGALGAALRGQGARRARAAA